MIDTMENKLLDIGRNLLTLNDWNSVLLFWGSKTSCHCGMLYTSRINGVFLDSMVGEMMVYTTSSYELKTIIAVLGSSFLTPRLSRGTKSKNLNFSSGSQNSWFAAVFHCFRPLCFNLKGEIVMSITNIKFENRKAIILSFQDCFIGKINKDEIYIGWCDVDDKALLQIVS